MPTGTTLHSVKISDNSVVNADINSDANIALSKTNLIKDTFNYDPPDLAGAPRGGLRRDRQHRAAPRVDDSAPTADARARVDLDVAALVREKPRGWEYLLYVTVVSQGLRELESKYWEHFLRYAPRNGAVEHGSGIALIRDRNVLLGKVLRIDPDTKKIGLSARAVGKDEPIVDTKIYSSEAGGGMASLGELADFGLSKAETGDE